MGVAIYTIGTIHHRALIVLCLTGVVVKVHLWRRRPPLHSRRLLRLGGHLTPPHRGPPCDARDGTCCARGAERHGERRAHGATDDERRRAHRAARTAGELYPSPDGFA